MNNKIWIFSPNTNNYKNVSSLNYLWQIEWNNNKIQEFFINYDWEIIILNKLWLYKVNFEVSNDKIILR